MSICGYCKNQCDGYNRTCSIKCKLLKNIIIDNDGCWIWQHKKNNNKYGCIRWNKKWISTHRASYIEFVGTIEPDKVICHKCDKPLCINPDHLFQGSQKDNIRDCVNKKRNALGEKNSQHLYTDDQINEMRRLKKEGFTYSRLIKIFNISPSHLTNILTNKNRKE